MNLFAQRLPVVLLAVLAACGGSSMSEPTPDPTPTATPAPTDFAATAEDFECLPDMARVRNLRIANSLGYLDEAIALAEDPQPGEQYPLGTILQLVPGEAMVKRGEDWDPDNNNWEYFELDVSPEGTSIRVRGREDAVNRFGLQCLECHKAAQEFDFVCEKDHGCVELPFGQDVIDALQDGDPRCG